jgi:hypothetical protein
MPRCRGTTMGGRPCSNPAQPGREFCGHHEPGRPPNCIVCRDPRRTEIEAASMAGLRDPDVARRFRMTPSSVRYHRLRHMPPAGGEGAEKPLRPEPGAQP